MVFHTDYDKAIGTHLACLNKSWRNACRTHPRAFWSRAANAELLGLVNEDQEPEPTVAAIEAALGRGADPNAALEWAMSERRSHSATPRPRAPRARLRPRRLRAPLFFFTPQLR